MRGLPVALTLVAVVTGATLGAIPEGRAAVRRGAAAQGKNVRPPANEKRKPHGRLREKPAKHARGDRVRDARGRQSFGDVMWRSAARQGVASWLADLALMPSAWQPLLALAFQPSPRRRGQLMGDASERSEIATHEPRDGASAGTPRIPPVMAPSASPATCHEALHQRGVTFQVTSKPGVADAVRITGPLGGVTYIGGAPLDIDCALAVALHDAGPFWVNQGLSEAHFSSAYSRRYVRGTTRWSKHSFGLAIDVHWWKGLAGKVRVDEDFEQGLGDTMDCIGQPATVAGAILKTAHCQLTRSGWFALVLTPDYDDAHHDHFHLEVKPWSETSSQAAALALNQLVQ